MTLVRARLLVFALSFALATAAHAQALDDSFQVPVGVLKLLDVPLNGTNRSLAMMRAIRVLHSAPRQDPLPQVIADFDRLLPAFERLERELKRTGDRGLALAMASDGGSRDALADALEALGLRLREQRRTFTVEARSGNDDAALRALLLAAGIDAADLQKRLNAGATVHVAQAR